MAYLVLKTLHLISMVAWFAGLFYMFRLFVYHTENKDNPDITKLLKVMEGRLYKIITVPAMVLTFVFGISMIMMNTGLMQQGWLHIKILLVVLLGGYTGFLGKTRRRYANDDIYLTSKQCRIFNEVPTLFLVAIMFLVIVFRQYLS